MSNRISNKKINLMKKTNIYPLKLKGKLKFLTNRQTFKDIEQKGNLLKKIILKSSKDKLNINKTSVNIHLKTNFPTLKIINPKKHPIERNLRNVDNIKFNTLKKGRRFSQQQSKSRIVIINNYEFKKNSGTKMEEKSEEDAQCDINIEELMEKIHKEYSDIGKIIKINFVLDKDRKYIYEKNEHVLLKIIENDLKDNYGLEIKEFIFKNQKLNVFRTLKENNIVNNSVINIII